MDKLEVDANPAWKNVISDCGDIDIMPIGEKHEQGANCKCRPSAEVYGSHLIVIHNSYDKREFIEQAISVMNGNEK